MVHSELRCVSKNHIGFNPKSILAVVISSVLFVPLFAEVASMAMPSLLVTTSSYRAYVMLLGYLEKEKGRSCKLTAHYNIEKEDCL